MSQIVVLDRYVSNWETLFEAAVNGFSFGAYVTIIYTYDLENGLSTHCNLKTLRDCFNTN